MPILPRSRSNRLWVQFECLEIPMVVHPASGSESCLKGSLQVTVKTLAQTICLQVVCHGVVKLGAYELSDSSS